AVRRAKFWSGRPDSNRRHRPWQGRTLPTELLPPDGKLHSRAETFPVSNGVATTTQPKQSKEFILLWRTGRLVLCYLSVPDDLNPALRFAGVTGASRNDPPEVQF